MQRITVFILISLFLVALDFYLYQGLKVAISPFPNTLQRVLKLLFWTLTVITVLGFLLFQPMSQNPYTRTILTGMMTIGLGNIVGKLLFALWLLIDDIIRLAKWGWQKLNPAIESEADGGISRSEFLTQAGAVSAVLPLLGVGWGVVSGAHDYRVVRRTLEIEGLPASFDGFTITQISDIHAGSFWNKKAVERGVSMINDEGSDVIFFTGDLVNNRATELDDWMDVFSKLKASNGVYSVLGNHDYGDYVAWDSPQDKENNLRDLIARQEALGWDLLMDEHRHISKGKDKLAIVGIQNWGGRGRFPKYGDMAKATAGIDSDTVQLLLSHDPSHWKAQVLNEYPNVNAMFSGHTHGFQFGIEVGTAKWSPVKYFYPEWADLYREGSRLLYVNRGFGYIGYPGRIGILPEITVHTLRPKNYG